MPNLPKPEPMVWKPEPVVWDLIFTDPPPAGSTNNLHVKKTMKKTKHRDEEEVFNAEQTLQIQDIVETLGSYDCYLGGSRQMLRDWNYSSRRDWDFNVPFMNAYVLDDENAGWARPDENPELAEYLRENFTMQQAPDGDFSDYAIDSQFVSYWKHNVFPHITIIVRYNLPLYKRAWKSLGYELWHDYTWKSSLQRLAKEETPEEVKNRKILTKMILNSLYEACRDPNIEEFM